MISKVMQNSSFRVTTKYVLQKEEAELIGGSMGGQNTDELTAEFLMSRNLNPDIQRPVYHFTLSLPHQEHLNNQQWQDLSRNYLEQMGLDPNRNQYFVARHSDQKHEHVHIVASRINLEDGKVVETWRDRYRSQEVIRKLERDYGLSPLLNSWEVGKRAMTKSQLEKLSQTGILPVKQQLQQWIDQAAIDQPVLPELVRRLQDHGIEVQIPHTRTGKVKGISYAVETDKGRVAIAGSAVGSHYSLPGLQKHLGISYDPHRDDLTLQSQLKNRNPIQERSSLPVPRPTIESVSPTAPTYEHRQWQQHQQQPFPGRGHALPKAEQFRPEHDAKPREGTGGIEGSSCPPLAASNSIAEPNQNFSGADTQGHQHMDANQSKLDPAPDSPDGAIGPADERLEAIRAAQKQYERSLDNFERSLREFEHELAIGEQYVRDPGPGPDHRQPSRTTDESISEPDSDQQQLKHPAPEVTQQDSLSLPASARRGNLHSSRDTRNAANDGYIGRDSRVGDEPAPFPRESTNARPDERQDQQSGNSIEKGQLSTGRLAESEGSQPQAPGPKNQSSEKVPQREASAVRNLAAFLTSQKLIHYAGKYRENGVREYEGEHYLTRQVGNRLTVTAKDGRGEILSCRGDQMTGNLTAEDTMRFSAIDQKLEQFLARQRQQAQTQARRPKQDRGISL